MAGSFPRTTRILQLILGLAACTGPEMTVLRHEDLLARNRWLDNRDVDWYADRIPLFESPDSMLDATYYYRWEVVTKHLTYGSPETGYTFTEFIDRPFWSGAYGAISCPLGHQHYEVRWLKDRRIIDDFARYWFETPGAEPRSYSNWYGDAMWATYLALGDTSFLRTMLPHMLTQYEGWVEERWDSAHGMFRWDGMHDGMEFNINSRLTDDHDRGAEGYRPTLNSYLYADLRAIASAAGVLGDRETAQRFADRAAALKQRVQDELWDPDREFFFHQFARDELGGIEARTLTYESGPYAGSPHGRELIGYVPWQFNLPDPGYEAAWKFLMDTAYFAAPFGPTTVERGDPQFLISPRCCVWSGNSWPYATTQTLVALANLLNDYEQDYVDNDDYVRLLQTYARTHRQDGRPYIAEAADPLTGSWAGHDTFYHSEHYFHSGYVDLVITGLVGLRPRADDTLEVNPLAPTHWDYFALDEVAYHGHMISIVWDRDGTRYHRGRGLTLFVNGRRVASRPDLGPVSARIPPFPSLPSLPSLPSHLHNWAVNNGGAPFPLATASYSAPLHPPFYAVDGSIWYHRSPPNRWTAQGSPNAMDWFEVDFGVERAVETVKLYVLDDAGPAGHVAEGGAPVVGDSAPPGLRPGDHRTAVRPPADYRLEAWVEGEWREIPGQTRRPPAPEGRRANVVSFDEIRTSRLRVVLTHADGAASGLAEFEAWGRGTLPAPVATVAPANLAFGATVSASYASPTAPVDDVHDMRIAFTRYSRNGWTAVGSPNREDWLEMRLDSVRTVAALDLYLLGRRSGLAAPASYRVSWWNGESWRDVMVRRQEPDAPTAWARNRVAIEPVLTDRVRITFEHALPASTGVTEVMIWGKGVGSER
jgi:hypothetical protein